MRIALVGWDTDDTLIGALAGLGAEVVVFTRWFRGQATYEDYRGWVKHRCPHAIGGGLLAEAASFRESVLGRVGAAGKGMTQYDVVHALDPLARPAAYGLAERSPLSLRVASVGLADVGSGVDLHASIVADCLICDHPWTAERWRSRVPGGLSAAVVPGQAMVKCRLDGPSQEASAEAPSMVLWVPREAEIDVARVTSSLVEVRAKEARFSALVLGSGPSAEALRRRLQNMRVHARVAPGVSDPTQKAWASWLASASVVGIATANLGDDPAAWAAWSLGVPVVDLGCTETGALEEAVRRALHLHGRTEREVRAGAALASRRLSPTGVALGWLKVYLEGLARPSPIGTATAGAAHDPSLALASRSRLSLIAIGTREAYASWHVRPDDRATALEWLGADAVRASLVLRFFDITDIEFNGTNAHAFWDVELALRERFRTVNLAAPGRSLTACLGLRTPRGYFHPLAHAGPTHLPREYPAAEPPTRWLHALARS